MAITEFVKVTKLTLAIATEKKTSVTCLVRVLSSSITGLRPVSVGLSVFLFNGFVPV